MNTHAENRAVLLSVNGQTLGPYSDAYVQLLMHGGKLPATAMVCAVGEHLWRPLFDQAMTGYGQPPLLPVDENGAANRLDAGINHRQLPLAATLIRAYALFGGSVGLLTTFVAVLSGGLDFVPQSYYFGLQGLVWLFALVTQVIAVVLLFLGRLELGRSGKRSVSLLLSGFAVNVVADTVYAAATLFLVAAAAAETSQHFNTAASPVLAITNLIQFCSYLFEVFALVWLCVKRSQVSGR